MVTCFFTQEKDDREEASGPLLSTQWHLNSLSPCNSTSHMLHFLLLLTYADLIFKVRARTKTRKRLICLSLCWLRMHTWFSSIKMTSDCRSVHVSHNIKIGYTHTNTQKERIHQNKTPSWHILSLPNNSCTDWEINIISATEKQSDTTRCSEPVTKPERSASALSECGIKPFMLQESMWKQVHFRGISDGDCCSQNTSQNV